MERRSGRYLRQARATGERRHTVIQEMMQVISNLIMNSIYGMPAGGTLSISTSDSDVPSEGVALTVADDGVGIAPEILPKVFDAFFTTPNSIGTGIGLFIAKQFVESHGGEIGLESNNE
jgi:signal transduction histidine kinase